MVRCCDTGCRGVGFWVLVVENSKQSESLHEPDGHRLANVEC